MFTDLSGPLNLWMPIEWYGRFQPGLPDLCVGKYLPGLGRDYGDDRFKVWIVETTEEAVALRKALDRTVQHNRNAVDFRKQDAVVSKPGTTKPFIGLYEPTVNGWPYITVACVPPEIGRATGAARGIYIWHADDSESMALARLARLHKHQPAAPVCMPNARRSF